MLISLVVTQRILLETNHFSPETPTVAVSGACFLIFSGQDLEC